MMNHHEKPNIKKIGEILIERGLVTRIEIEHALRQQRSTSEFLGAILVRIGAISAEALLDVLSEQFKIPKESLSITKIDWRIAKQFPASIIQEGKCFPVRADSSSVTVAIVNPLDAWMFSDLEKAIGARQLKPVLVLENELQAMLKEHTKQSLRVLETKLRYDDKSKIK